MTRSRSLAALPLIFPLALACASSERAPGPWAVREHLELSLACPGSGRRPATETTTVQQYDRDAERLETATAQTQTRKEFSGTAYVEVSGTYARVRLPDGMVPALHGGDDGWYDVSSLTVDEREITGKLSINFANHPKLHIDRTTGRMEIDGGKREFAGDCEPGSAPGGQKF